MQDFIHNRPPHTEGEEYSYLKKQAMNLKRMLVIMRRKRLSGHVEINDVHLIELSQLLIEWGEDIHYKIGLWKAYEEYCLKEYGTYIPFAEISGEEVFEIEPFHEIRVAHFIRVQLESMLGNVVLSTNNPDILALSEECALFLEETFEHAPPKSTLKAYLYERTESVFKFYDRLKWMAMHSYLFRARFRHTMQSRKVTKEGFSVFTTNFMRKFCSPWAGMSAADFLSALPGITDQQAADLQNWRFEHYAIYEVLKRDKYRVWLKNLMNGEDYEVKVSDAHLKNFGKLYTEAKYVIGSVIPWGNYFIWVGPLTLFEKLTEENIEGWKKQIISTTDFSLRSYETEQIESARTKVKGFEDKFKDYFGSSLVLFETPQQMEQQLKVAMSDDKKKGKARKFRNYDKAAMALFFHPSEGYEILRAVGTVRKGFSAKTGKMTDPERHAVYRIISSASTPSAQFVEAAADSFGKRGIFEAFFVPPSAESYALDYLLHRYKGTHFKETFPRVDLRDNEESAQKTQVKA